MNSTQIDQAISNAQRLMSPEGQMMIESSAAAYRGAKKKGGVRGGSSDLALFEQQAGFGGSYASPQEKQAAQMGTMQNIKASFSQTPAMSGNNFPADPNMGYVPGQSLLNETRQYQQPQQQYVPQYQPQYQPQYVPQPQGIDYNMIKYMVNEAIKENLGTITQSLNESTIRGMKMCGGNKFQFLDMKGNLYEGTMVLKKKAQQQ